ncbi:MarR family transcriptional regulator [Novosphingobium sp.]|uniref:MarR family winged helix-turn-helix transcriptional regulator n=1 Tax=Novosphingobium sp. TaxID=1874826 RepID=UPI00262B6ECD|nr:MarR family transcriptional regulator [Novosphingobium sp.]
MSSDEPESFSVATEQAITHLREHSFGRLLLRASRQYNEAAIDKVRASGHPQLTLAHAAILPHIDIAGTRLTEVARRAGLTKQSASELIINLQQLGYVSREADPDDRRSQRVVFTASGRAFLQAAYLAKTELELDLTARLGRANAEQLVGLLRDYLDGRNSDALKNS